MSSNFANTCDQKSLNENHLELQVYYQCKVHLSGSYKMSLSEEVILGYPQTGIETNDKLNFPKKLS
jgi:hypothetical protein